MSQFSRRLEEDSSKVYNASQYAMISYIIRFKNYYSMFDRILFYDNLIVNIERVGSFVIASRFVLIIVLQLT